MSTIETKKRKRAAAHEAIERIRKLGMYESGCGLAEHLENQFVKKLGFRDLESLLIFMGLPADIGQVRGPHKERES